MVHFSFLWSCRDDICFYSSVRSHEVSLVMEQLLYIHYQITFFALFYSFIRIIFKESLLHFNWVPRTCRPVLFSFDLQLKYSAPLVLAQALYTRDNSRSNTLTCNLDDLVMEQLLYIHYQITFFALFYSFIRIIFKESLLHFNRVPRTCRPVLFSLDLQLKYSAPLVLA